MPKYVLPIIALLIGYPQSIPKNVPKLERAIIMHKEKYNVMSDDIIIKAYENKYGELGDDIDDFLKKNYKEAIEYDRQLNTSLVNTTKERIKKFEIQNPAQFLFNLRYPTDASVAFNKKQLRIKKCRIRILDYLK